MPQTPPPIQTAGQAAGQTAGAAPPGAAGERSLKGLSRRETWVFDLDNTLYSPAINLFSQVERRITEYIAEFLGLPFDEARRVQKDYFRRFGTSMRGMMTLHNLDPKPFLDFVHAIDVSVLDPSPAMDAALKALPGRKLIFTNADTRHAERVLDRLGVAHHFEAIFDIHASDYRPKPEPTVYDDLVRRFRVDPRAAVMVEDIAVNLAPAAAMGMTTVWIRSETTWAADGGLGAHVHHVVDDLVDWLEAVIEADRPPAGDPSA